MFGKKKSELKEKLPILIKENIVINNKVGTKEEVITAVGNMLVQSGYVEPEYVSAMLEREKTFITYMGNNLALPHGIEAAKKKIKQSGMAVMVFPEGIAWGEGNLARVVIGLAGVGDEHIEILSNIAVKFSDEEQSAKVLKMSVDEIYEFLTKE